MPIVMRRLGSMFDSQPTIGTPDEVATMQQLVSHSPPMRAASAFAKAPMQYKGPTGPGTAIGMRPDGTVGYVDATDSDSASYPMAKDGANTAAFPRFNPNGGTRAAVDQRSDLEGNVDSSSSGAQYPEVQFDVPADQVLPEVLPEEQMSVSGSVSGPTNWMLAAGIALGLAAVVGIAVAVTR